MFNHMDKIAEKLNKHELHWQDSTYERTDRQTDGWADRL